jgi:hypothetical protein
VQHFPARMPAAEPDAPQTTFDDWKDHQLLNDDEMLDASGADDEIAYWELERAEGRDPYED